MRRRRSGFTLVELLVSIALLASVASGVAVVMSTCLNSWRVGAARAELSHEAGAILDIMAQDLRASFAGQGGFFVSRVEADQECYLEFTTLSRRMLRLLHLAEYHDGIGENLSDHAQVIYYTQPADSGDTFALYRREICPPFKEPLGQEEQDAKEALLLSDKIASFRLRFCDDLDAEQWLDEWDYLAASEQSEVSSLPAAVEISLALSDGQRRLDHITRVALVMRDASSVEPTPIQ